VRAMKKHHGSSIKRSSTLFLQVVIVFIGIVALVLMLTAPQVEGRNANASLFEIYFNDPFLAYAYIGSIPFFVALFQAFKLLGYIGQNKVFSQAAVNTLKTIKYCAFITAGVIVAADAYLRLAARNSNDDPAGAIMLGMIVAFVSIIIGAAAAVFQKTLKTAVDLKSENDLTV
jgi:hypothetical protein